MDNSQIAKNLKNIGNKYKANGDQWRSRSYYKAANLIKSHPDPITSKSQAMKIKGIGNSVATTIADLLNTGTTDRLEKSEKEKVIELFCSVWGIGPSKALTLYNKGHRSLDDLNNINRESKDLTHDQHLGLQYYDDILKRIPRREIIKFDKICKRLFKNSTIKYMICGSYRRNEKNSGDIDLLITSKICDQTGGLIRKFTDKISDYLIDTLALGDKKYMGLCMINKIARRIDIRAIERPSWAYGTLYFTGSAQYNVHMRNVAIRMGLSLSEYCLEDNKGNKIMNTTEEDIFETLRLDYLEPNQRYL